MSFQECNLVCHSLKVAKRNSYEILSIIPLIRLQSHPDRHKAMLILGMKSKVPGKILSKIHLIKAGQTPLHF